MPSGLQIFDKLGNSVFDTTRNYAKFLGTVAVAYSSNPTGSINDSRLTEGIPFCMVLPSGASLDVNNFAPMVTIYADHITWEYHFFNSVYAGQQPVPATLLYGIY
jgi:hypothetical protein